MNDRDDQQQEEKLKQALQRIYENIEVPDSTESWLRVQNVLQKRKRRKRWLYRLRISSFILLGSLVLHAVLATATPTTYSNMGALFKRIHLNMIEIFHEQPEEQDPSAAKTPPPGHTDETSGRVDRSMAQVTLEEAIDKVPFLLIPTEVPDDFRLNTVRLFGSIEKGAIENVQLEYVNDEGDVLNVIQQQIVGDTPGIKASMDIEAGDYKEVTVNGTPAVLMTPIEGNTHLEWLTNDRVLVRISGKLAESDIIKLAASLMKE